MKKTVSIITFVLFSIQIFSQISLYKVSRADEKLHALPRFSVDIGVPVNIIGPWAIFKSTAAYLESGLFVTNNGFKYDQGDKRYVHRVIGLSVPVRAGKIIQNKYYLGSGFNINLNMQYKQKTYDFGTRNNKEIVEKKFFSKHDNLLNPSIELYGGISIHALGRFGLRAQMFPMSFLSPTYKETINGLETTPYADLIVAPNFKIMFSYNPGL